MSPNKLTKLLFTVLMISTACSVTFPQKRVIGIEEAINIALANNRDIRVAEMNVRKAESAVDEAFGYALPSLDLSATYYRFLQKPKMPFPDFAALLGNATYGILFDENVLTRDESKFKPVSTALQSFSQTNNFESSVQLTQVLFNSAVLKGIGSSKIYLDLSKEDLKRTISAVIFDVKKTFYGVMLSKALYEITEASFNNASQNFGNVKALHGQGFVSEFDNLQAEVRIENIRPVLLQMENTYLMSKDGLKILLGIDQSEDIEVTGEFIFEDSIIPDETEVISAALQDNYSIRTMQLKIAVDDAFIDLDRSDYWPSLAAFANYSYSGSADNFKFQKYSAATVGVSFSINLFRGIRTYHKVEQAEISKSQSEEQFTVLKDYIASQVKSTINDIRKVKASLEAQQRNVKLAERAYELATIRYKEGTGNQLEIENADIALRQAKINHLQSVYEYIVSKSELDQLVGRIEPVYLAKSEIKD